MWLIRLIQVGLGGLSCVLVWSIGRRLFSPVVGRWSGVAAVVYGPAIYYGGELTAAALAVFLSLLLLWGLVGSGGIGPAGHGGMGIGMGITAAATGLVDYRGWLVAVAALGWMVKGDTGRRMGWWFFAGTALVLAPAAAAWGWEGLVPARDGAEPVDMARRAYLFWHGAEVVGDIDPYRAATPSSTRRLNSLAMSEIFARSLRCHSSVEFIAPIKKFRMSTRSAFAFNSPASIAPVRSASQYDS